MECFEDALDGLDGNIMQYNIKNKRNWKPKKGLKIKSCKNRTLTDELTSIRVTTKDHWILLFY